MHFFQRFKEIGLKVAPGHIGCGIGARDKDIIPTGARVLLEVHLGKRAQAAFCAVAHNSIADLFGGGKSHPWRGHVTAITPLKVQSHAACPVSA